MLNVENNNKGLAPSLVGGAFYVYLFLISVPVFVNISSNGIRLANSVMKMSEGFSVNVGILLVPALVLLLSLKLANEPRLRVGSFGSLILVYCFVCFIVMLLGQIREPKAMRLLLVGQVITPFVGYFYLLNFSKCVKFRVVKRLLIVSLLVQFGFFLYFNYRLFGKMGGTASTFFRIDDKVFYLYGIYDYYPILFLTLVIFFHEYVNSIKNGIQRNILIVFTILLYGYGLVFHSRNSLVALVVLFGFYLFRRRREKAFSCFFMWTAGILLTTLALKPSVFVANASISRVMTSLWYIRDYLVGQTPFMDPSTVKRIDALFNAFSQIGENPLLGIAFQWAYAAHNQYLSILGVSGIVAFLAFLVLLVAIYRNIRRNFILFQMGNRKASIAGAMYGILVLFIVSSLFQNNFSVTYTSCLFWALLGCYETYGPEGA